MVESVILALVCVPSRSEYTRTFAARLIIELCAGHRAFTDFCQCVNIAECTQKKKSCVWISGCGGGSFGTVRFSSDVCTYVCYNAYFRPSRSPHGQSRVRMVVRYTMRIRTELFSIPAGLLLIGRYRCLCELCAKHLARIEFSLLVQL